MFTWLVQFPLTNDMSRYRSFLCNSGCHSFISNEQPRDHVGRQCSPNQSSYVSDSKGDAKSITSHTESKEEALVDPHPRYEFDATVAYYERLD